MLCSFTSKPAGIGVGCALRRVCNKVKLKATKLRQIPCFIQTFCPAQAATASAHLTLR